MAHLSPIYFHKLFSLRFGKTPYQYIAEMRITAAKDMLLTTEKPLGDIAAACGFSTQSYFHNQFKAAVGQTPAGVPQPVLEPARGLICGAEHRKMPYFLSRHESGDEEQFSFTEKQAIKLARYWPGYSLKLYIMLI